MSVPAGTLLVGVGSPHADDQAGWLLIERLSDCSANGIQLRKAKVPHEILDWIDGCEELHIIDACERNACKPGETVFRLDCSQSEDGSALDSRMRSHSSHQLGLGSVIQLGRLLGSLPRRVTVWGIPGEHFRPDQSVSDGCRQHVAHCAELIRKELITKEPADA